MKIFMNLLLLTTQMEEEMLPILRNLKQMGYDGVEVPVFDTDLAKWKTWSARLKELKLSCTAVTFCGAEDNPVSPMQPYAQKQYSG
jgi:D-psicose/D-tagatose/L-ribulose 3-epimerase